MKSILRGRVLLMTALVAGLSSCSGQPIEMDGQSAATDSALPVAAPAPEYKVGAREAVGALQSANAPLPAPAPPPPSALTPQLPDIGPNGLIIRVGSARIEVDSLEVAIGLVRALAQRVGGFVANIAVETGSNQLRRASLEVKVPAARFDEAVNGLQPIGKVEAVEVNAQDVGEEYVDITARVANARRLEERLITLLATRTGRLQDVLSVERELARVREEIERMEGRLRYLRTRVSLSTLSILVHEPAPLLLRPGENVIAQSARQAWRNFVSLLAGLIAALGFILPIGMVALAGVYGIRSFRRKTTVAKTAISA